MSVQWDRVRQLFHGALDRDPDGRATYLDSACAGDAELRAEVDRLLAEHAHLETFMNTVRARELMGEILNRTAFEPGEVLCGRYRVERLLGHGGMGEVYEVEQIGLRERYALKTVRGAVAADPSMMTRFLRELQVSRSVTCLLYTSPSPRDS